MRQFIKIKDFHGVNESVGHMLFYVQIVESFFNVQKHRLLKV